MVGHLREEKDPLTYWRGRTPRCRAKRHRLRPHRRALDPALARLPPAWPRAPQLPLARRRPHAERGAAAHPGAHVLVHASRIEGGARRDRGDAQRHAGAGVAHRRQPGLLGAATRRVRGRRRRGLAALLARAPRRWPAMLAALAAARLAARSPLFDPSLRAAEHRRRLLARASASDERHRHACARPRPPSPG